MLNDTELTDLVKRLKTEQEDDVGKGKEKGLSDGVQWMKQASLVDVRHVCERDEDEDEEDFVKWLEETVTLWADRYYLDNQSDGCDRRAFMAGYVVGFTEGAQSVWEKIQDQL